MNNLRARADNSPYYDITGKTNTSSNPATTKIITTIALLVLGYYLANYALSLSDIWSSTIKRSISERVAHLMPSQVIYAMQTAMMNTGWLHWEDARFTRASFGDLAAKQDALRTMFGQPRLPLALRKVRSISESFMPMSGNGGPAGLGNWDNSCYQNSVLQGFASLPTFLRYIEESEHLCQKYDVSASTHQAFVAFLEQLSGSSCRTSVMWTPRVLKSMDSWQQQDAQEYFSRILEAVEKEAGQYAGILKRSNMAGLECLSMFDKRDPLSPPEENSMDPATPQVDGTDNANPPDFPKYELRSPVEGMTAQCLLCRTCGFTEGLSLTQFNCLTLNLGLQGACDVETLLEEYTAPEEIEGVECDNCTRLERGVPDPTDDGRNPAAQSETPAREKQKPVLRTKAKQITIARLPRNLVLHLNRSIFDEYGNQQKNTAPVNVSMRLDFLSRWCAPLDDSHLSIEGAYELKCMVTHYGSHHDGHYVAWGKRDKDWYCFNDERVTAISEEEVLSRGNAFMLFYEAVPTALPLSSEPEGAAQQGTDDQVPQQVVDSGGRDYDQESMMAADEQSQQVTDEDSAGSEDDVAASYATTQRTTPASSENSSPTEAQAEDCEKANGKEVERAQPDDVSDHTQNQPGLDVQDEAVPTL